jgi:hypothetical protein
MTIGGSYGDGDKQRQDNQYQSKNSISRTTKSSITSKQMSGNLNLEEALAAAICPASLKVLEGQLKPKEVKARIEVDTSINFASPIQLP